MTITVVPADAGEPDFTLDANGWIIDQTERLTVTKGGQMCAVFASGRWTAVIDDGTRLAFESPS